VLLLVQLSSQAAHASPSLSSLKPGKSAHEAKTQRLLACCSVGAKSGRTGTGGGAGCALARGGALGGEPQETRSDKDKTKKLPTINEPRSFFMGLILLEALLALLLLLLIVWWTMFSGRQKGELKSDLQKETAPEKKPDTE
jgi:hypothetical protein